MKDRPEFHYLKHDGSITSVVVRLRSGHTYNMTDALAQNDSAEREVIAALIAEIRRLQIERDNRVPPRVVIVDGVSYTPHGEVQRLQRKLSTIVQTATE